MKHKVLAKRLVALLYLLHVLTGEKLAALSASLLHLLLSWPDEDDDDEPKDSQESSS